LLPPGFRKEQVLTSAERETTIILSLLVSQSAESTADALSGLLGASGHQATRLDANGVLVWSTAANPRLLYSGGIYLHSYGNAIVVGVRAENNPMKRWSGALVRAEHEYADGARLVVTQPLARQVADLNSRLTTVFGFLLLWLAAAAGTAFLAATLLVRPLERLRRVAEMVQKGGAEVAWPSFGILEIQELRDSLVAMTGALEQRGIDLAEAIETAEDLMKRGEKYLAFMSHELKAPLAALSAALSAEDAGAGRIDPGTMRESLTRLLELIDDILDQARSSTGSMTLRSETFDPAHETTNLLEAFAIQARRKGLAFSLSMGEALSTTVRGDPLRYRQLIANLVSNAVKYTQEGRISVRLEGQQTGARLDLTGTVEDTGIGIPADRLQDIWRPFSSIGVRAADGQSSHGLGLSIVRSIAEAMSGSLELESREGRGSVFTFQLAFPLEAPAARGVALQAARPADTEEKPDLRGMRILVADDERISRMAISHFLRTWGATVDECESGDEALAAYSTTAYSLLILDEHMPGPNGSEVIKHIRDLERDSSRGRSFLAISSAEAGRGKRPEAAGQGGPAGQAGLGGPDGPDALLPKPVQQSALKALLLHARLR